VLAVIGRPLLFASIDPDVAAANRVPVRALSVAFLVLLGLAAAEASQITGTLLVFALLVMPAATAQVLTARPAASLALTVLIGLGITWTGLAVAYYSPYPIGFFVTTFGFAAYVLAQAARNVLPRLVSSWRSA
jgi:zinc/manganese transport system permease protein